jgi:hypothetical protein
MSFTGGSGTFAGFAIAGALCACGDDAVAASAALKISAALDVNQPRFISDQIRN